MSHHPCHKKFLPYVQYKPTLSQFKTIAPCTVSTGLVKKSFSVFLISNLCILKGCNKVCLEPSLLPLKNSKSLSLSSQVFQTSDHFHGPPLKLFQQVQVFLVLGTPELDTVLQVWSHCSGVEGQNHLSRLLWHAGHTYFDAAQDMVGFLGCKCPFLDYV